MSGLAVDFRGRRARRVARCVGLACPRIARAPAPSLCSACLSLRAGGRRGELRNVVGGGARVFALCVVARLVVVVGRPFAVAATWAVSRLIKKTHSAWSLLAVRRPAC